MAELKAMLYGTPKPAKPAPVEEEMCIRDSTMLALLTAMSIVFARVLSISTGFVRLNLGSLPTLSLIHISWSAVTRIRVSSGCWA